MKKTNLILLIFLTSCITSQNTQLKKSFKKEKLTVWKYDAKTNTYPSDLTKDINKEEYYLWTKYKDYLTDKDTIFVLKKFGTPNIKDKNNKYFIYYYNSDCEYYFSKKAKQEIEYSYNYTYFKFDFENNKLKKISLNSITETREQ